jgi:ABC-type multidrug transport system fused ATPase/permease subunit
VTVTAKIESRYAQRFMGSILVSSTVFVVVFAGALAGMGLRRVLPENLLGPEAKEVIRLATGLLVTMTALVLGMLVSTANSSYQERKSELAEMGSNFVLVDGLLASYGPDAQALRAELRGLAERGLERVWPSHAVQGSLKPQDKGQFFYDHVQSLVPKNETQIAIKAAAISAAVNLRHTYWLMFLGTEQSTLSLPLLLVVVSWLTFIFISFGLFAPGNRAVFVTLVACALAVSAAVFIIMAMYTPFSGVMRISSSPIRDALSLMGP